MGGELLLEIVAGAEQQAFDGGQGHVEDDANVFVRHVFVTAKGHGEALFFGKALDSAVNGGFEFFALGSGVGLGALRGGVLDVVLLLGGFDGDFAFASAAAHFIEDEVAGDGEQPGGEFGAGFVARGGTPDADKDLLGHVVGIVEVVEHAHHRSNHGALMGLHQLFKGAGIPFFDAEHQAHIFLFAEGERSVGTGDGRTPFRHVPRGEGGDGGEHAKR